MILAKFEPNRTIGSKVMDKKLIFAKTIFFGTVLEPGQLPGSRVPGILQLPGSNYPVPDKPNFMARL